RSAPGISVRRELRASDDGYRDDLVAGLRASADAARLADEIAFSSARLLLLAADPPGPYARARDLAGSDPAGAGWICFVIAYLGPLDGQDPFAGIDAGRAADDLALDGIPLGPRTSHDPARGSQTLAAFRQWLGRASGGAGANPFAGEPSWSPERRFERLYDRL